jgi:hypothetical protein
MRFGCSGDAIPRPVPHRKTNSQLRDCHGSAANDRIWISKLPWRERGCEKIVISGFGPSLPWKGRNFIMLEFCSPKQVLEVENGH